MLIWYGGQFPLIGHTCATAAHHFGPFKRDDDAKTVDDLSAADNLMAYIALGYLHDYSRDVASAAASSRPPSTPP